MSKRTLSPNGYMSSLVLVWLLQWAITYVSDNTIAQSPTSLEEEKEIIFFAKVSPLLERAIDSVVKTKLQSSLESPHWLFLCTRVIWLVHFHVLGQRRRPPIKLYCSIFSLAVFWVLDWSDWSVSMFYILIGCFLSTRAIWLVHFCVPGQLRRALITPCCSTHVYRQTTATGQGIMEDLSSSCQVITQ